MQTTTNTTEKLCTMHKPSTKRFALTLRKKDGEENADENIREMETKKEEEFEFRDFVSRLFVSSSRGEECVVKVFQDFLSYPQVSNSLDERFKC